MAAADGQLRQADCRSGELGAGVGIAAGLCIAAHPGSAADPDDASISEAETEVDAAPTGNDADADRCAR